MDPDAPVDSPACEELRVTILQRPDAATLDVAWIAAFAATVMGMARAPARAITVVLAGDDEVRSLNSRYRGKDRVTDVLSFPADDSPEPGLLGELVIAVGKASRQAAQRHHALDIELRYLLIHGILHLMGFDHETDDGEMEAEERRVRALLSDELQSPAEGSGRGHA